MFKPNLPKKIKQGQVYYVEFPKTIGSVQNGIRPVVVTQQDNLNRNSTTFVCALITSQNKRLDLAEHVLLKDFHGLKKLSMVMAEQRFTVDKQQLVSYCGRLDYKTFGEVRRAIRHCERCSQKSYINK